MPIIEHEQVVSAPQEEFKSIVSDDAAGGSSVQENTLPDKSLVTMAALAEYVDAQNKQRKNELLVSFSDLTLIFSLACTFPRA